MNYSLALLTGVALLSLSSGCIHYPIVSDKQELAANSADVARQVAHYVEIVERSLPAQRTAGDSSQGERWQPSLERIGHQLGSYRHYPKNTTKLRHAMPVLDIMSFVFDRDVLDAVELDVRLIPGEDTLYVIHDEIPEGLVRPQRHPSQQRIDREVAASYLRANRLSDVLESFLANPAWKAGAMVERRAKKIYIEIKTQRKWGALTLADLELIDALAMTVDEAVERLSSGSEREAARRRIGYVSFNLDALRRMHVLAPGRLTGDTLGVHKMHSHTFHLILGSDRALKHLPGVAVLGSAVYRGIDRARWLTGVWLDPRAIADLRWTIDRLKKERQDLKLGLSTYYSGVQRFRSSLDGTEAPGVESVIVEPDFGGVMLPGRASTDL